MRITQRSFAVKQHAIPNTNNMNIPHRHLIIIALFLVLILPGCRTARAPVAEQDTTIKPTWTSEADKLRSTAMLIEAARQKALGNWSQATVLYHDAVTADPGNDAAHFELARIHAMQGQFEDALSYAQTAVELSPRNHHYLSALADIYILSNRLPEAIGVYEQLAQAHPDNPEYAYNLASAYVFNQQHDKALQLFAHLENLVGFTEEISIEKQKIWVERGEYDKAIEEAKRLIELFPDEPVYYELLADLYRETGQLHEARKLYEAMLKADPTNPMAQLLMAEYHLQTGDPQEAFTHLYAAFENPLVDTEGKARIIYRYFLLSEEDPQFTEQGLMLARLFIEQHPDDPESYLIYGDFLNRENRLEAAREAYLKAARLDPSSLSVWQQILSIDGQLADFASMRDHSDMALEYFFEQPVLFLFNGLANLQLKDYNAAASSLEYGLMLAEFNEELKADFHSLLGDTYHYLGDHERSDTYYEKALEANPENAVVLNNYSYHLSVRKERLDEAERMSKKALTIEPENAAFLDTHGWIMYQLGRYEEARTWIKKSLQHATEPSAVVLEHYGDVMYKLGDRAEALRYWEKAKAAGEGTDLLEKKIRDETLFE